MAMAEMAFAGGLGVSIDLSEMPHSDDASTDEVLLFSESNTRFIVEVQADKGKLFSAILSDVPHAQIGEVNSSGRLSAKGSKSVIDASIEELKAAWQAPLGSFA